MLQDADRLQHTVEQVLRAGVARQKRKLDTARRSTSAGWCRNASTRARTRHHLADDAIALVGARCRRRRSWSSGDVDELRTAIANLLDNAVKYSADRRQITVELAAPRPTPRGCASRTAASAFRARSSAHLQPLLPLPAARLEGQGHRPRPLHRALDRQAARRPRVRRERRRGQGRDASRSNCRSCAPRRGDHEPHPDRRRRAAPRRRPALQPRSRRPRGGRRRRRRARRSLACSTIARATTPWCST